MKTLKFFKKRGVWYVELPGYLENEDNKDGLVPVVTEGFDTLLNIMANSLRTVTLTISLEPFDGADELELIQLAKDESGGYYLVKTLYQEPFVLQIWLSKITKYLYGCLPEKIYFKHVKQRVRSKKKTIKQQLE